MSQVPIWEDMEDETMFPITNQVVKSPEATQKSTKPKGADLFRPSQDYAAHVMHFLKKPIQYYFQKAVLLQKTKYSYRVSHISDKDQASLNSTLKDIEQALEISGSEVYMTGKEVVFKNTQYPDRIIEFNSAIPWKLVVSIQGYKESPTKKVSPIWKITHAYQSI